ncbi:hypothetical protein [Spirulina sp. 06S082]|uniref:hypothetical protein n=1 Tax=Spirulina sp. 06S082 TaxID=3110248 RepID=UPI002B21A2DB|nr:hypothetical protein [Spirulina sp. 06S082]
MPRSLRVDPQYREDVKMSLIRSGYTTQRQLAEDIELALSTVNKFFNCKPIYNLNFIEICNRLDLNWDEIIDAQSQNLSVDNMEISSKLKPIAKDKARIRFTIEATIEDLDKPLLDELIKLIQERSLDASFTLKRIEEGSLMFTFEGSQEGSKRLQELFQNDQLKELLGLEISTVDSYLR